MPRKLSEEQELKARLDRVPKPAGVPNDKCVEAPDQAKKDVSSSTYVQWSILGNGKFIPVGPCIDELKPGVYNINSSPEIGIYFDSVHCEVDSILRFPDSVSDEVLNDIGKFWDREELFRKYHTAYKRGVLLWGPPGSGKTCTIKLLIKDLVARNGIVLLFTHPKLFCSGLKLARAIQPNTPIIVLMEDIDAIIETYNESEVINILDGVDTIDKVVFVATTNYPEKLGARIINRPSRFDKRHKVDVPSPEARQMYFEHLIGSDMAKFSINLQEWVDDTEGMSVAHLKELFVGTCLLGDDYASVIDRLRAMSETKSSSEYEDSAHSAGFALDVKGKTKKTECESEKCL